MNALVILNSIKQTFLSISLFASLHNYTYCPAIVTNVNSCETPYQYKILYIKQYKSGDMDVIKQNGEVLNLKSGDFDLQEIERK